MKIFRLIREAIKDPATDDPNAICAALFGKVVKADLRPLLLEEIKHHQRERVRDVECRNLLAHAKPPPIGDLDFVPDNRAIEYFRELLGERVQLGDGRATTWGAATLAQHRIRIEMLSKQRDGLDRSIDRHLAAVAILEQTGAPCLQELATVAA